MADKVRIPGIPPGTVNEFQGVAYTVEDIQNAIGQPRISCLGLVFSRKQLTYLKEDNGVEVEITKDLPNFGDSLDKLFVYRLKMQGPDSQILETVNDLCLSNAPYFAFHREELGFVFFDSLQLALLIKQSAYMSLQPVDYKNYSSSATRIVFSGAKVNYGGFAQYTNVENNEKGIRDYTTMKAEIKLDCGAGITAPGLSIGIPCPTMWGNNWKGIRKALCNLLLILEKFNDDIKFWSNNNKSEQHTRA